MSNFNPYQDQQFGGAAGLKFFTDLAPRRVMLGQYAMVARDQGQEQSCTGQAASVSLDIFCGYRGQPLDLSWSFIFWVSRQLAQGPLFNGEDVGVDPSNVYRALYAKGACLQALAPNLGPADEPSPEAFADAATRKVALFERIDLFDCKNAVITALAHGIPVTGTFAVTNTFSGIESKDPIEQMALYNFPSGRIGPGFPDFLGYHELPLIGYDLDLGCVFVQNSEGPMWGDNGVAAISLDTMVAQIRQAYAVREFAGLTSYVDPKWIVAANAHHDSTYMLGLRRYMYAVLTRTDLTQLRKSQITRDAMPLYGASAQDLADAAEPWGVTLQTVEDFLALSA